MQVMVSGDMSILISPSIKKFLLASFKVDKDSLIELGCRYIEPITNSFFENGQVTTNHRFSQTVELKLKKVSSWCKLFDAYMPTPPAVVEEFA